MGLQGISGNFGDGRGGMNRARPIAVVESFWALRAGIASALDGIAVQVVTVEKAEQLAGSDFQQSGGGFSLLVLGPGSHRPTACSAVRQLRRSQPKTPLLVVFERPGRLQVVQALRSGATGCVSFRASREEFVKAVESTLRGRRHLDPWVARLLCDAVAQQRSLRISDRESQVLILLCQGLCAQQIAERLEVSRSTIESHKKSLMRKLEVRHQLELVARARHLRLVT